MKDLSLKDHYKNQKFNNLHEFFWGFGTAFHTVYAVVPLFLKELGAPNVIATSSAGLFSIIIAIPMLFTAALTRNVTNMKKMVISAHCIILVVAFFLGYVFAFSDMGKSLIAWKIYFILFITYSLSIGIIVPIWADFLEKTTKRSLRGKFFGVGFAFNSLGAFGGGLLLKFLLETNTPFPKNFGYGFIILFLCLSIGTSFFAFYKEKKQNKSSTSFKQFKIETKQIIKNRPNFHRYLFSRIFYCASLPAIGLYAVFCQKKFGFNISEIGSFTVLNVISMGISSYVSGYLGDKHGHKISMLIAYSFHLVAVILALLSKNMFWVYCIFISIGAGQGAFMPSAMNLIYDFADLEDKKTYMAIIDSFLAPFSLMFLVGIGFLITKNQFVFSFYIIGSCLFIALLILYFYVKDPKLKKISA
jgi:MFS family permease